jgi:two-component system CheB/CheR fusion protein
MVKLEVAPKVQIFATDLDGHAVTIARHGRYRQTLSGVSPERLERWFAEEGDDYCVVKDVREMCVYSIHNLAKDPPFSKLDLISCRNLLIYFDAPLQNRLVRTFHYALRPSVICSSACRRALHGMAGSLPSSTENTAFSNGATM